MEQEPTAPSIQLLHQLLTDPGHADRTSQHLLKELVQQQPQSGLLQALYAGVVNRGALKHAGIYIESTTLYKLAHAPQSLSAVTHEQFIIPAAPMIVPETQEEVPAPAVGRQEDVTAQLAGHGDFSDITPVEAEETKAKSSELLLPAHPAKEVNTDGQTGDEELPVEADEDTAAALTVAVTYEEPTAFDSETEAADTVSEVVYGEDEAAENPQESVQPQELTQVQEPVQPMIKTVPPVEEDEDEIYDEIIGIEDIHFTPVNKPPLAVADEVVNEVMLVPAEEPPAQQVEQIHNQAAELPDETVGEDETDKISIADTESREQAEEVASINNPDERLEASEPSTDPDRSEVSYNADDALVDEVLEILPEAQAQSPIPEDEYQADEQPTKTSDIPAATHPAYHDSADVPASAESPGEEYAEEPVLTEPEAEIISADETASEPDDKQELQEEKADEADYQAALADQGDNTRNEPIAEAAYSDSEEPSGIDTAGIETETIPDEQPEAAEPEAPPRIADVTEKLIIENIAATDYFIFDKAFRDRNPTEVAATAPHEQEEVAVPTEAAETPAGEENNDVSRYHDDKMPYSFMWWLDKTRREHAGVYQPYAKPQEPDDKEDTPAPPLAAPQVQASYTVPSYTPPVTTAIEPEAEPSEARQKEHKIIERFVQEEPHIKPPSSEKLGSENKAKRSAEDQDEMITETLARIYSDQMLYAKAIATYKKLILKYPEKSTYFADQILLLQQK